MSNTERSESDESLYKAITIEYISLLDRRAFPPGEPEIPQILCFLRAPPRGNRTKLHSSPELLRASNVSCEDMSEMIARHVGRCNGISKGSAKAVAGEATLVLSPRHATTVRVLLPGC
jgi:hypothetical protein